MRLPFSAVALRFAGATSHLHTPVAPATRGLLKLDEIEASRNTDHCFPVFPVL